MSGLLGMLGAALPQKATKPKKATAPKKATKKTAPKKATAPKPKKAASKNSTTSRVVETPRSRKTVLRNSEPSPPRTAKASAPEAKAKRGGTRKRAAPHQSPASAPKQERPLPVERSTLHAGTNPIALPKGFKGRAVVYLGHRVPSTKKVLYKGEPFVIRSACWFKDYKDESKVHFQIFHERMKFALNARPQDVKIGKKNLTSLAAAMLKHAGR